MLCGDCERTSCPLGACSWYLVDDLTYAEDGRCCGLRRHSGRSLRSEPDARACMDGLRPCLYTESARTRHRCSDDLA
jgi:hypothetical protein